jgi:hypothetical protein
MPSLPPMDLSLYKLAFAFHSAATALSLGYLFSRDERLTRWMWRLLGVGLALHLASFGLRTAGFWAAPEHRWFLPVHSFFGALSWLSLATASVFWWVEGRHRVRLLGAFVGPPRRPPSLGPRRACPPCGRSCGASG